MTRKKKPTASYVRSSAAEYLTFVAARGTGGVEAVYANENVWLRQKMMAQLYDVEVPTINYHLKKVFEDSELDDWPRRSQSTPPRCWQRRTADARWPVATPARSPRVAQHHHARAA